ncbi:MAG TPA: DUF5317 domain-containing protein [Mycobacteriales bacterium]|nr:DUF5317 domain-containing protein [Mycobacteriales bacterium]
MALALILLVGAALVALATGGRWAALANLPVRGRSLVLVAVIAQIVGGVLARITDRHGFYPAGLAISAVAGLAFCLRNIRLAGVPLVTLGLLCNALVVLLNGAMPVSAAAAARANVPTGQIASGSDARHGIADAGTTWRWLGDVIPAPLPWRPEVVSPGDALIAAGLGEFVLLGLRPRRRTGVVAESDVDTEAGATAPGSVVTT